MYKKLEKDNPPRQAKDRAAEGECVCVCRKEKGAAADGAAPVDKAAESLAVYYEING